MPIRASSPAADHRAEALVGTIVSARYRLDELIAIGGMGAVYRAEHVHMHKLHAIKVLHPSKERLAELVARFRREAIVGAHIQHPNIAAASDFGELDDGSYFLVTEFVAGRTLHARMLEGPVDGDLATAIAFQIALALGALHDKGILHRDLKPRNVMLADDALGTVKVIDFGLAKVDLSRLPMTPYAQKGALEAITEGGVIFGTVAYIAPEAALGMDVMDARADLYALGVILYEMLAGKHLFDGSPGELFMHHRKTPPPSFAERAPGVAVHPAIAAVVMRLLAKEPEARFASAADLGVALDAARVAAGHSALSPPRPALSSRPARSDRPRPISSRPPAARVPKAPLLPELVRDSEATPLRIEDGARISEAPRHAGDSMPTVPRLPGESGRPAADATPRPALDRGLFRQAALAAALALLLVAMLLALLRGRWSTGAASAVASASTGAATTASPPATELPRAPSAVSAPIGRATAAPNASASSSAEASAGDEADAADAGGLGVDELAGQLRQAAASRRWPRASQLLVALVDRGGGPALAAESTRVAARDAAAELEDRGEGRGDAAFAALERAGAPGLDVLYDIVQSKGKTRAQARADAALHEAKVLAAASPELKIALALRDAPCDKKLVLLDRAVAEGDVRTLTILETFGVGCFRKDRRLLTAIRKLKERLGKP